MKNSTKELGDKLKDILGSDNVYFQPPESYKMSYPCIRYELSGVQSLRADDLSYKRKDRYTVMRIGKKSDEHLIDAFLDAFPYCAFDRRYVSENLYHDVFTIYY